MTEQQPYTILRTSDGYELREYPACAVAEVTVDADFDKAGSLAFQPLFTYISGNNLGQMSIDMTAPVVQRESGELETGSSTGRSEKLSMTAPVLQSSDISGRQVVAFVLPSSVTATSAPTPVASRVVILRDTAKPDGRDPLLGALVAFWLQRAPAAVADHPQARWPSRRRRAALRAFRFAHEAVVSSAERGSHRRRGHRRRRGITPVMPWMQGRCGALDGIRTHTVPGLSRVSLPVGLRGRTTREP